MTIDRANSVRQSATLYEAVRRLTWFPWVMQPIVARRMDKIITVSQAADRNVREAFGLAPEATRVVYNGVDTDLFRPHPEVERQPNMILYVANSEDRNKGARYFFEALARIKDEAEFRVVMVDRPRDQLKLAPRLIQHYGLDARVTITGRISDAELVRLYNAATFSVTSSLYEGFGLPAAQSLACGTPTIATTGGALPEIIDHGVSGWLVPPGDSEALAAAMRRFLKDAALRERLGQQGVRSVRERFSWRKAAEQVVAVYEEAIASRGGGHR
jgi:glycosyltransferase involved in cell wall biosynthesis